MFTYVSYRRGQYDSVLAETAKLTSGETAESRHNVGLALENASDAGPIPLDSDQMRAYFNVLWTFERLYALYVSLRPFMLRCRLSGPQRLLLQSISGSILTWAKYDERLKNSVDSEDSSTGLRRLADALDRLTDP